jgi:hypothetical protein
MKVGEAPAPINAATTEPADAPATSLKLTHVEQPPRTPLQKQQHGTHRLGKRPSSF